MILKTLQRELRNMLSAVAIGSMILAPLPVLAGGVPYVPSSPTFSEPSQLIGTLNSLIQTLNGVPSALQPTPQAAVSLGSFCTNAAGVSPQTCNGQRGLALFTGITVAATGTTQNLVINDSTITAASGCLGQLTTTYTAGSGVTLATLVPGAGTLTATLVNAGATANAVTTGTIGFQCFQ